MKHLLLYIGVTAIGLSSFCQDSLTKKNDAMASEVHWQKWIKDLYEVGVEQVKDSVKISEDVKQIILDTNYQKSIYPAVYTMPATVDLFKKMEIKKAIWYLINIYGQVKELKQPILNLILPFEKGLEMDKVLISTFYTYAMIDPAIGSFKNGKIEIDRPDILEQKFNSVKEIVAYILSQRKAPNNNAQKSIGATRSEEINNLGKGSVKTIQ